MIIISSPNNSNKPSTYTEENIVSLAGLDGVRKRPAMYIGSTGKRGWHHLAFEIIDNSIDENVAGVCDTINVILERDNSLRIRDNGRGIPTGIHPQKKIPTVEVIFTNLHTGGKFDKKSYTVSGGLHGVGLSVVNACSEWVNVTIKRDGKKYNVRFGKGHVINHIKEELLPIGDAETGTEINFYPDKEIFPTLLQTEDGKIFDYDYLAVRLRDLAFLNPIKIILNDLRDPIKSEIYHYKGGIIDFVKYLNQAKKALHPDPIYFRKEKEGVIAEIALQYNDTYNELIQCYVNNINTIEGGTHLTGFKNGLTKVFNDYIKDNKNFKTEEKTLKGSDVREGLTAVLAIRVPEPQFEGQTKTKLGNVEVQNIVNDIVYEELMHQFDINPEMAQFIVTKCLLAQRARIASQKAREATRRKTPLDSLRLPGKLADCSNKDAFNSEIFIVEGDSAGGSAKQGRDRESQAILPLRGKILNVEKARMGKMFENKEITSMIKAIGVGFQDKEDESTFDITKLRYNKIIIMCDADVDGAHIKTLLLTFFFRYMRKLIDEEHIYVAVPPIYKLSSKKDYMYLYDENKLKEGLKQYMDQYGITDQTKVKVQRFKGLGEMNPEELWETTMDPTKRRLLLVKYEDFINADNIFSILMGDEVEPRRNYILDHYHEVLNLDV